MQMLQAIHSSLLKKQDSQDYTNLASDARYYFVYRVVYSQSKAPYSTFNLFSSWYVTPHPCMMKNILKIEGFNTAMQNKEITYHLNRSGRNRWKVKNQMAVR